MKEEDGNNSSSLPLGASKECTRKYEWPVVVIRVTGQVTFKCRTMLLWILIFQNITMVSINNIALSMPKQLTTPTT